MGGGERPTNIDDINDALASLNEATGEGFSRILVALDPNGDLAAGVAQTAHRLAQTLGAEVRYLAIAEPQVSVPAATSGVYPPDPIAYGVPAAALSPQQDAERRTHISRILTSATGEDEHDVEVRYGSASDEIQAAATEWSADLIILGARTRGWLQRMFDPSTSEHVARDSSCAVMILPERALMNTAKRD